MRNGATAARRWWLVAALAVPAVPTAALTGASLLGTDLEPQAVTLSSLAGGQLRFFDVERRYQTVPVAGVVRVTLAGSPAATEPTDRPPGWWLTLADGQTLPGAPVGEDDAGQRLRFVHDGLGEVLVPLEQVVSLRRGGEPARPAEPASDDRLVLQNDDVLTGFVTAVTADGLTLETAGGGATVDLPWDRLAAVTLANLPAEPPAGLDRVRLVDGATLWSRPVRVDDAVTLFPRLQGADAGFPEGEVTLPLASVRSVEPGNADARLADPVGRPITLLAGGEPFGLPAPPHWAGDTLQAHAPSTFTLGLPAQTRRLRAHASLALPAHVPDHVAELVQVRLRITAAGRTLVDHPLRPGPHHAIDLTDLPADGTLQIELTPGEHGPVLGRVRFDGFLLLVNASPPPASDAE